MWGMSGKEGGHKVLEACKERPVTWSFALKAKWQAVGRAPSKEVKHHPEETSARTWTKVEEGEESESGCRKDNCLGSGIR